MYAKYLKVIKGLTQAHPQKFWFVENLGKIAENVGKTPENPGNSGAECCLTSKNGAQRLQKNTWRPFLEAAPKKGHHDLCGRKFVGKSRTKTF